MAAIALTSKIVAEAIVRETQWNLDCSDKRDFDCGLIRVSTRSYPDNTAYPSILLNLGPDQGEYITLAETEIKGDTRADCHAKAERWIRENIEHIIGKLFTVIDVPVAEIERVQSTLKRYTGE